MLGVALLGVVPVAALPDATPDPVRWPTGTGSEPELATSPYSVRLAGPDRSQTSLAATLALVGSGGYPFTTVDRTGGWWGAGSCPRAVIVVAGDTFADALGAASLSDPTNRSSEPRLARVAAADPLFDPVGGFDRVDTDAAPMIVTESARQGATALSAAARVAVVGLSSGHCATARDAVIVGGDAAVPEGVESELLSLGYREVFRVSGDDRFGTAAAIATALGTGVATSAQCIDPTADDGRAQLGFHGNAAPEFRQTSGSCRVLSRSVVLADGGTGADALAAGWWTSYWQVPILLTAADGSLPPATRVALQTLEIDNVIVLGGVGRIPEPVVEEAGRLASAAVGRITGADRYETSVAMARAFGGWFGDATGASGRSSVACVAASAGSGAAATGWPDALTAGPLCGRLSAIPGRRLPARALPPVSAGSPPMAPSSLPGRDAVPVLLVPTASGLPASVDAALGATFDPDATWCTGSVTTGCLAPGFAVVFGGPAAVPDDVVDGVARRVSGSRYLAHRDSAVRMDAPFYTELPMDPVFTDDAGGLGARRVCWLRGGLQGVRSVWTYHDDAMTVFAGERAASEDQIHLHDADGVARSPGVSAPFCTPFVADGDDESLVGASGPAGELAGSATLRYGARQRVVLEGAVGPVPARDRGSSWEVVSNAPPDVTIRGVTYEVGRAVLLLSVHESDGEGPSAFEAIATLETTAGIVGVTIRGEVLRDEATWRLRGVAEHGRDLTEGARGGFVATIARGEEVDEIVWRLDGSLP